MIITHFSRNIIPDPTSVDLVIAQKLLIFFMKIEPLTSALFLFLSGFSTYLALNKYPKQKIYKQAIKLYLISGVLALVLYPPSLEIIFTSSSILLPIAVAMIINAFFNNDKVSLLLSILISLIDFILFQYNIKIIGINGGFGSLFPTISFALLGFYCAKNKLKSSTHWILTGILALLTFAKLPYSYTISVFFYNFQDKLYQSLTTWNHHFFGVIQNSIITLSLLKIIQYSKLTFLNSLGKKSLEIYIFHLLLLRSLELLELSFPSALWTITAIILFIILLIITTKILDEKSLKLL